MPRTNTNRGMHKMARVMGEFKRGSLKSSSGQKVTNPAQAKAIALSEARQAGARVPMSRVVDRMRRKKKPS